MQVKFDNQRELNEYMPVHPKKGFTLVELLVVISIIAILSVIGITVFSGVQKSARDTKRREDLAALANAVRIYSLTNHAFPPSSCSTDNSGDWSAAFKTALAPYMTSIPVDPINTGWSGNSCSGGACIYCFTPNMWCGGSGSGTSCNSGIANFWTYQENCSASMIGDSARFQYGCSHYMKSIDPF